MKCHLLSNCFDNERGHAVKIVDFLSFYRPLKMHRHLCTMQSRQLFHSYQELVFAWFMQ